MRPCPTCRGFGTVIPDPCSECSGDGRVRARRAINVKIPAGVDSGNRIQLSGQGEVGPAAARPATSTSRSTSRTTRSSPATATTCCAR